MRRLAAILAAQAALFVALPWTGSAQAWGIFASFNAEIADGILHGVSPWDQYDGLVAGPLALAGLELPLVLLLGLSPWVHVLSMLAVSLAGTALAWAVTRRLAGDRAAVFAALLVAFPPPNTWYHQHQGAYHLLGLLGLPAALLLLWRADSRVRWGREIAGWTALAGGLTLAPGGIGPAAGVAVGLFALRLSGCGRAAWKGLGPAAIGGALAALPILYKGAVHTPFGGLAAAEAAARQTKPLILGLPKPIEIPGRLAAMLLRDLPYGLHFDSAGVPVLAGALVAIAAALWIGLLVQARKEPALRALLPILLVPPFAVVVGLLTGWFVVGHAPGQEPFPRDARHLLGLCWFGALILGVGLARLRWRPLGAAVVGVAVLASIGTQIAALGPARGIPYRLESRYIQGFFVGSVLRSEPAGAAAWCARGPRSDACLSGVAMVWGHRRAGRDYGLRGRAPGGGPSDTPGVLRRDCAILARSAGRDVVATREACFFGLGFGLSDQALRRLDRTIDVCDALELDPAERSACVRGAAWGQAQNFWNRPGAIRRWIDEQATGRDRVDSASGVGILVAMLASDAGWAGAQCHALVPADGVSACLEAAAGSEGFVHREDR